MFSGRQRGNYDFVPADLNTTLVLFLYIMLSVLV